MHAIIEVGLDVNIIEHKEKLKQRIKKTNVKKIIVIIIIITIINYCKSEIKFFQHLLTCRLRLYFCFSLCTGDL